MHNLRVADIPINQTLEDINVFVKPRMIPGRSEIFLVSEGYLMLWDFNTRECIWKVEALHEGTCCLSFDFELLYEGQILILACVDTEKSNISGQMGSR
jgi:hypothetical protein